MPYDPGMAERVRDLLEGTPDLVEKKMFGGIGWTIGGNMAVGASSSGGLIVRCAKEDFEALLAEPGADGLKKNERNMAGWLLIDGDAVAEDAALATWVERGRRYAASLPKK